jgi:hypothetical protein
MTASHTLSPATHAHAHTHAHAQAHTRTRTRTHTRLSSVVWGSNHGHSYSSWCGELRAYSSSARDDVHSLSLERVGRLPASYATTTPARAARTYDRPSIAGRRARQSRDDCFMHDHLLCCTHGRPARCRRRRHTHSPAPATGRPGLNVRRPAVLYQPVERRCGNRRGRHDATGACMCGVRQECANSFFNSPLDCALFT